MSGQTRREKCTEVYRSRKGTQDQEWRKERRSCSQGRAHGTSRAARAFTAYARHVESGAGGARAHRTPRAAGIGETTRLWCGLDAARSA